MPYPSGRKKAVTFALQGPVTFQADGVLRDRGIHVIPDIVANGGGVTVSFFEWVGLPRQIAVHAKVRKTKKQRRKRSRFTCLTFTQRG